MQLSPDLMVQKKTSSYFGAYLANELYHDGMHISTEDFALTKERDVLQVKACGSTADAKLFLLCDVFTVVRKRATSMDRGIQKGG